MNKCAEITMNKANRISFKDGTRMQNVDDAVYLGCIVNNSCNIWRELNNRLSQAIITWKKMSLFWRKSDVGTHKKLQIYDAVIRAKIVYGLETIQLTDAMKSKIIAFRMRELRQQI